MNDIVWITAEASAGGSGCLQFADGPDGTILMRDSKQGDQSPILRFTPHEVRCFLDGRQRGEFVEKLQNLT